MRVIAAYLLILLTVAGLVTAVWFARRRERRDHHSVRYVIDAPDAAEAAKDTSPEA